MAAGPCSIAAMIESEGRLSGGYGSVVFEVHYHAGRAAYVSVVERRPRYQVASEQCPNGRAPAPVAP